MDASDSVTAFAMAYIRQQRLGTALHRKETPLFDPVNIYYPFLEDRTCSVTGKFTKRPSWLEHTHRKSFTKKAGVKFGYDTEFPDFFRDLYTVRFNDDEDKIVLAYGSGAIEVWNVRPDDHYFYVRHSQLHGMPIMCVRFIPMTDDRFFAASACGTLYLCGMKKGRFEEFVKEESNEINSVDCSLDGDTAVTVGKDAAVRLYDIHTATLTGEFSRSSRIESTELDWYHAMRIFTVKFHPTDNNIFLTGGWDNCVKVWDSRVNMGCVQNIRGPHICGEAVDVKGTVVVTGSWTVRDSLQLWDLCSGKLIDTITPMNRHSPISGEFLYCATYFAGDTSGNTVVVGGSGLTNVEVISLCERKVLVDFKVQRSVRALATSKKVVVFGGLENVYTVAAMSSRLGWDKRRRKRPVAKLTSKSSVNRDSRTLSFEDVKV